jgi:hypothetical protein
LTRHFFPRYRGLVDDLEYRLSALVAEKLRTGSLIHPGDAKRPPKALVLPIFTSTVGLPKEMADLMASTAVTLAEAIVHTITAEGGVQYVETDDIARLRTQEARSEGVLPSRPTPVHCRCDKAFVDPLMFLTLDDSPRVQIDGRQLIAGLTRREAKCPHRLKEGS